MLQVTPYTNTDSIRAVLGVTDNEVTDEMLVAMPLEAEVLEALASIDENYATLYSTGAAEGASAEEARTATLIRAVAAYKAASAITHLELTAPERFTDGKTGFVRAALQDRFDAMYARVRGQGARWERRLRSALGQTLSETNPLSISARPAFDPVTDNSP